MCLAAFYAVSRMFTSGLWMVKCEGLDLQTWQGIINGGKLQSFANIYYLNIAWYIS